MRSNSFPSTPPYDIIILFSNLKYIVAAKSARYVEIAKMIGAEIEAKNQE